jgi:DNA gyrase/topoisomerase IV subunit B
MKAADEEQGFACDIAMQYSRQLFNENIIAFANNIKNIDGGMHLSAFQERVDPRGQSTTRARTTI